MPEIRSVTIKPLPLPEVRGLPEIRTLPATPPVTLRPGIAPPIIELPGCVPVHPDQQLNPSLLKDDPNRVGMFCPDGEMPSFNPMDFRPSELQILEAAPANQNNEKDEAKPSPELPGIPRLPRTDATTTQEAKPAAEKPFIEQAIDGLPDVGAVVTTTTIALVATTSALVAKPLADLILKTIKPTVKKTVKAIAKLRGKTVPLESVWERRVSQRERNLAVRTLRRALKP